jgi:hypothetical protein
VDAAPGQPEGLFHRDTRFLSRWKIRVDGREPELNSSFQPSYFSASFFLSLDLSDGRAPSSLSVVRKRFVGAGMHPRRRPDQFERMLAISSRADHAWCWFPRARRVSRQRCV